MGYDTNVHSLLPPFHPQKKILFLFTAIALAGLRGAALAQPPEPELSRHLEKVAARDKVIPIDRAGSWGTSQNITVDGNLDEWGSFSRRSGVFFQDLDHLAYRSPEGANDAAGVKLLRDDNSIYIALRVVDHSVFNVTKTEREFIRQDCVELFFDVRPVTTYNGAKLGDSQRSDGFYQLFFVPPTPGRGPLPAYDVRWCNAPAQADLARMGPLDVAGRLSADGYDLEIRIPYTSFFKGSSQRFDSAFGFDVFVDDMDIRGQDTEPPKTTASDVYSWGGLSNVYADPSRLSAASPNVPAPQGQANQLDLPIRLIPARLIAPEQESLATAAKAIGSHYSLRAARALCIGPKSDQDAINMKLDYAGSAFDSSNKDTVPETFAGPIQLRLYRGLDVKLEYRDITLGGLPGGRYILQTNFAKENDETRANAAHMSFLTRYYSWDKDNDNQPMFLEVATEGTYRAFDEAWVRVQPTTCYPSVGQSVTGTLSLPDYFLTPNFLWNLSEQADHFTHVQKPFPYVYQLAIHPKGGEDIIFTQEIPFRANPVSFTIPPGNLGLGDYELEVTAVNKSNNATPVLDEHRPHPDVVPLTITPVRSKVMHTTVKDAPKVWKRTFEIGNPNKPRHPLDDMYNAPQRNITVLEAFKDRIYAGSGIDYEFRPAIPPTTDDLDIWSFNPAEVTGEAKVNWTRETNLALSQVAALRVIEDGLYVSAARNRWWQESFSVHVKSRDKWETISRPDAPVLNDIVVHRGKLYAATGGGDGATLLVSNDLGRTWKTAATLNWPYSLFTQLASLPQGLLATVNLAERETGLYADGQMKPMRVDLFPDYSGKSGLTPCKLQAFAGGVVYTVPAEFDRLTERRPLFFLRNLNEGAVVVESLADTLVQDIKVRNGKCYVLTARKNNEAKASESNFLATIYSSSDLTAWTREVCVELPALPNAFEMSSGTYFIGLSTQYFGSADSAAGSIWAVKE